MGCRVIGIDISAKMVENANLKPVQGFEARVGDLENSALFDDKSLDLVLRGMVVYQRPDIRNALCNFNNWPRPGGKIAIIEPDGSNPIAPLCKLGGTILRKVGYKDIIGSFNETRINHTYKWYESIAKNPADASGIVARNRVKVLATTVLMGGTFS